jgi:branched-chain amino acid transport system permease protein
VTGDAPGLDLVIYGCVLIAVVAFAPRGIAGLFSELCGLFRSRGAASAKSDG